MQKVISCGPRSGHIMAPPSKSELHRLLIVAAQGRDTVILADCFPLSEDIRATLNVLRALGADIEENEEAGELIVDPIRPDCVPEEIEASCGESGSTLRFMLPLIGSFGVKARLHREGKLAGRPLREYLDVLEDHGMSFEEDGTDLLCEGTLESGDFGITGEVSSQYISGLLMTLPFMPGKSTVKVFGEQVSASYIEVTEKVLKDALVAVLHIFDEYIIPGCQHADLPSYSGAEGDFSGAAAFLCMGAFSEKGICAEGLDPDSVQADREIVEALRKFGAQVEETEDMISVKAGELSGCEIDAAVCPDLVPVLSVIAAASLGQTTVKNITRLRYKESDRFKGTVELVRNLGAEAVIKKDDLIIYGTGGKLRAASVRTKGDHRMAMAAAVAACAADGDMIIDDDACVSKSFPDFWKDFEALCTEDAVALPGNPVEENH